MGSTTETALTETIVDCVSASLAFAKRFDIPFVHFHAEQLFPAAVSAALAALPITLRPPASGKREWVRDRVYFNPSRCARHAVLDAVALAFQSPAIAGGLGSLCGTSLRGTFLRLEYAVDTDGFWLEPHTDLGVKKFTGLIPLSGGNGAANLGTDLYRSPTEHFGRAPFEPNTGLLFVPRDMAWI